MNRRPGARALGLLLWLTGALPAATATTWRLAPGGRVDAVTVSIDGRLAAVRLRQPGEPGDLLQVVDLATGRAGAQVTAGPGRLSNPCWLPGHRLVAAADGALHVWPQSGGPAVRWLIPAATETLAAAASAFRVAAAAAGGVVVVDARTGAVVARLATRRAVSALAIDEDGEVVVTAEAPTAAQPWSVLTRWRVDGAVRQAGRVCRPVRALVCGGPQLGWLTTDALGGTVWAARELEPQTRWDGPVADLLCLSPDRATVAVARHDQPRVTCWILATGRSTTFDTASPPGGLAFVDSDHLAVAAGEYLSLHDLSASRSGSP